MEDVSYEGLLKRVEDIDLGNDINRTDLIIDLRNKMMEYHLVIQLLKKNTQSCEIWHT